MLDLAWARFEAGDPDRAELLARQALEVRQAHLGVEHPENAVPLQHLGWLEMRRSRPRLAEPWFRQAWQLRQTALGAQHALTVSNLRFLTLSLEAQWIDRYPEMIELLEELEGLQRRLLGSEHRARARTLVRLANARWHLGQSEAGLVDFEEAFRVLSQGPGDGEVDTQSARYVGAKLLLDLDRLASAEALVSRSVADLSATHPMARVTLPLLARIRCSQGRVDQGLDLLHQARLALESHPEAGDWSSALLDTERAACLVEEGNLKEATTLLRRGLPAIEAEKGPGNRLTRLARDLLQLAETPPPARPALRRTKVRDSGEDSTAVDQLQRMLVSPLRQSLIPEPPLR